MNQQGIRRFFVQLGRNKINYLFILPAVLGVLIFHLGPMLASFFYGLTKYDIISAPRFIGIRNYTDIMVDPRFWKAMLNTGYYVLVALPIRLSIALGAALLLNQHVLGIGVFRTIFYLPTVTAGVAVSLLWQLMYEPRFGFINSVLAGFGVRGPSWLGDPNWAMPAIIFMMAFNIGRFMLIFLGGLQTIPSQLYEAVELDGGGPVRKFLTVTLPHLTPVLFFNIIIGIIDMSQIFTQAYVMTQGGPLDATLVYVLFIYENAFKSLRMGYASALAWILFLILFAFTMLQFRLSGRWVYYKADRGGRA